MLDSNTETQASRRLFVPFRRGHAWNVPPGFLGPKEWRLWDQVEASHARLCSLNLCICRRSKKRFLVNFCTSHFSLRIVQGANKTEKTAVSLCTNKFSHERWISWPNVPLGCWKLTAMKVSSNPRPLRGTVRRLLEEDLLPQHICGTSAPWQLAFVTS